MEKKSLEEVIWNYISLGLMAGGGLVFSAIIAAFYNSRILGLFNTTYAYYIVLSQLCVCGIHIAVTKYSAQFYQKKEYTDNILILASIMVIIISLAVVLTGSFICRYVLFEFFDGELLYAMNMIWPALIFFSINKVFLGYLNGLSKMKSYAFFQGIRNIFIALCIVVFALNKYDGKSITLCFVITEIILFLLEIIYICFVNKVYYHTGSDLCIIKELLGFSIKILPSNIVLELNTKVDVLCMSWILRNDSLVGIYSYAVLFAEGYYQMFVVLRRIINPKLTQNFIKNNLSGYVSKLKQKYSKITIIAAFFSIIIIVSVQYFLSIIMNTREYILGTIPLGIIMFFIFINMKSIIFGNILSQTGNPGDESIVNLITVISNIILNLIFISVLGIKGAALATGISYIIFTCMQRYFVDKKINIKL